jgi:acetolactate synthase small subunit
VAGTIAPRCCASSTNAGTSSIGEQTMTLEITGEPPHVDAVIGRLEPLGIIEMVRTGQVAMRRGDTALSAAQYS